MQIKTKIAISEAAALLGLVKEKEKTPQGYKAAQDDIKKDLKTFNLFTTF